MSNNFFSGSYFSPNPPTSGKIQNRKPKIHPLAWAAAAATALGFLTAIGFLAGIICGHIALSQIKRSRGEQSGRALALVAVTVSWVPIIAVVLIFGIVLASGFTAFSQEL